MIRQGLKAGEFHLLYQPIVDLKSGRTIGAEALVRWRRRGQEVAQPDVFIAAAERTRLISQITSRVLDVLSAEGGQVLKLAPDFRFAVNFSAADLLRPDLVERVHDFLARSGLAAENLVIEATEQSLVEVTLARAQLRQLRSAGIRLAIDDFGTGYSSLGYLAQLEVDSIKIDKLFVHALGTESATSHVAARIIDMSHDLNLKLVAEGVETIEQDRLLKTMKVDLAQGYLHGRPMTLDDLLQRLRTEGHAVREAQSRGTVIQPFGLPALAGAAALG
jgi:sensor c-di-GMP phosphodiesterase-like protein